MRTPPGIWEGQFLHLISVLILLILIMVVWAQLERPHPVAFWIAILLPVLHQVFVWVAWRLELQFSALSKTIGFHWYLVIFFILFGARFLSLVMLAWLDSESLGIGFWPRVIVTATLAVVGIYAIYSVNQYFGMARAAGGDHFDSRYREMPFVKQGIFQYTDNGMYLYAFLLFWAIAVGFNSSAGLAVAAFSHAYIWVHYFSTEKPDMHFLYDIE